ncbi:MAG: DNA (cytosine-5-)-methyltransferase [Selenomonadaceae bacterium]|nr:DNA (cytosine-5-)-methyltransferase [Selenomonadaceae bacterium]MBQ3434253.1 DNA (cytosine-5-)-methyltransferase [Selenomonadaceae bacterium]
MTLGSLFDGIGGWQRAAVRAGVTPLWSSEIDTFCQAVTKRHFPKTIQLGDINRIDDAPHVDIITAGSPCQSLSIAGRREGLKGASGLFFKAIELVRRIRPKFFIWENVPGALSSNRGLDFQTVLEEILQEPVPLPRHWSNAGLVDGRHCQLAWRILDAQFFGLAQRRKRIFLVADFGGRRAGQILFEPASVRRNSKTSESQERHTAARAGARADYSIVDISHGNEVVRAVTGDKVNCLASRMGTGGNQVQCIVYGLGRDAFNQGRNAKYMPTIEYELCPPPHGAWCRRLCHAEYRKAADSDRM